jgi:hypothetical protein
MKAEEVEVWFHPNNWEAEMPELVSPKKDQGTEGISVLFWLERSYNLWVDQDITWSDLQLFIGIPPDAEKENSELVAEAIKKPETRKLGPGIT